jgi:hypothetical protein
VGFVPFVVKKKMPSQFKIDELLKDHGEDQAALEAYARDPGRSIDELQIWLESRGYVVSRGAVWNWKQKFDGLLMQERFSRSGELAAAIRDAGRSGGAVAISEAAILQLSQVIFEQAAKLEADGEVDSLDLRRLTSSLKSLLDSKQRADQIAAEFARKEKEAVEAASNVAKSGGSPVDVVRTIKEALGIAA